MTLYKTQNWTKRYRSNVYCEFAPEHFKLYAPLKHLNLFLNIYANVWSNKWWPTYIFEWLREMYESQWIDKYTAAVRARAVVKDFFTVCQKLTEKQLRPFVLVLTNHTYGEQLPLHWHRPDEGQLWQWQETVQRDSEDQQLLNDWVRAWKAWHSKRDKQLSKNRRRNPSK